jgi:hypothetical protein
MVDTQCAPWPGPAYRVLVCVYGGAVLKLCEYQSACVMLAVRAYNLT